MIGNLRFTIIGALVYGLLQSSAIAMTCDELRAEIATLEKEIAQDEDVLRNCSKYNFGDCSPNGFAKTSYQAAELYAQAALRADQAQMFRTCGPPPRSPRNMFLFDVWTYHYDALRTGWNNQEPILTPGTVGGGGFGPLHTVPLDERVTAQPLLITNQSIPNVGVRDVVYVVTANNTVYAIDATTGAVMLTRNLGQPVAGCGEQNGAPLGILSTPVIDRQAQAMYLVTETLEDGDVVTTEVDPGFDAQNPDQDYKSVRDRIDPPQIPFDIPGDYGGTRGHPDWKLTLPRIPVGKHPEHKIHAIDLSTLADKLPPKVVGASHQLKDGKSYAFSSLNSRQRPGLVYTNRSIYAAFAVACEQFGARSRGWLLGWDAATLAPLPSNELTNSLEPYPTEGVPPTTYLSGIWMNGFGVAADYSGNLFFVTANSGAYTYGAPYNYSNSVMKVSGDLTVIGYFTPVNVNELDQNDSDFGSGGVLLMPDQPGSKPHLAVAAGKLPDPAADAFTPMFLLDRDNLGGFASNNLPGRPPHVLPPPNNVLGEYPIGGCVCGPSYFVGSDNTPRIVSSGGSEVIIWKVQTEPAPALVQEHVAAVGAGTGGIGFFTSVSSNGLVPDTAVIWAVHDNNPVTLSAFNAATGAEIYKGPAGSWRQGIGIYSIVPVVANGKVYVASDRQLSIFGLGSPVAVSQFSPLPPPIKEDPNRVVGEVRTLDGSRIILATPQGSEIQVDASNAFENHMSIRFTVGSRITVLGRRDENGIIRADIIGYAEPLSWYKK